MPGFANEQLVLVKASFTVGDGKSFSVGTGYFVTADLVLTASHVVPEQNLIDLEVRTESDGQWRAVVPKPVWRDAVLDAVLLRVHPPLDATPDAAWIETDFEDDVGWKSSAYPEAGKVSNEGKPAWKTVGLGGTLHAHGGGGQGPRELELTVEAPPPAEQWAGISGAPVFVGDRLAGLIKEVPKSFQGGRVAAAPATALFQNHGFRLALSPPWLEAPSQGIWVLVVHSESNKGKTTLGDWVDGALAKDTKALKSVLGAELQPKAVRVRITDALESPGHWLRFASVLCSAPIAIFDATGFEPAVMLALGVRAVVRRGVTLTSTADVLTPMQLSQLPFNIQETKLIHHGSGYKPTEVEHPLMRIPAAIKTGWQELKSQPNYLDLPAYDAVRSPYPTPDADGHSAVTRILVLCPFGENHESNWKHVANVLYAHYPAAQEPARMLDVASPRLVGQALYEGIRWAGTCVADWTGWRANVFFELGVRIGCADIGPINLIERAAAEAANASGALTQQRLLMALLRPTAYLDADEDDAVETALLVHDAIVKQRPPALVAGQLPHDATFRTCRDCFEWKLEHITAEPHELLRSSIEAPFGKDPQAGGRSPILFSANADYRKELDHSVKERWIAAWYYLSNRFPKDYWSKDRALRAELRRLCNDVLQFGLPAPNEAHLIALRDQIFDLVDEIEEFDQQPTTGKLGDANRD